MAEASAAKTEKEKQLQYRAMHAPYAAADSLTNRALVIKLADNCTVPGYREDKGSASGLVAKWLVATTSRLAEEVALAYVAPSLAEARSNLEEIVQCRCYFEALSAVF